MTSDVDQLITRRYRIAVEDDALDGVTPTDQAGVVSDKLDHLVDTQFGHTGATAVGYPKRVPWPADWPTMPGFTCWEGKYAVLIESGNPL